MEAEWLCHSHVSTLYYRWWIVHFPHLIRFVFNVFFSSPFVSFVVFFAASLFLFALLYFFIHWIVSVRFRFVYNARAFMCQIVNLLRCHCFERSCKKTEWTKSNNNNKSTLNILQSVAYSHRKKKQTKLKTMMQRYYKIIIAFAHVDMSLCIVIESHINSTCNAHNAMLKWNYYLNSITQHISIRLNGVRSEREEEITLTV